MHRGYILVIMYLRLLGQFQDSLLLFYQNILSVKKLPIFHLLEAFVRKKPFSSVVFCSLVFVLLIGFGFVYVFARSKLFRKKKKKEKVVWNCPNNLKYNTIHRTRLEGEGWGKGTAYRSPCFALS